MRGMKMQSKIRLIVFGLVIALAGSLWAEELTSTSYRIVSNGTGASSSVTSGQWMDKGSSQYGSYHVVGKTFPSTPRSASTPFPLDSTNPQDLLGTNFGLNQGFLYTLFNFKTASTTRFTNSSGTDVTSYEIGTDDAYVTVTDSDQNRDSNLAETVSVVITCTSSGDSETITLTETGNNTGVFRNTTGINSALPPATQENGIIEASNGDVITATYTDDDEPSDTSDDTATMTVSGAPPAPTLISPTDGSFTTDTTPSFDWSDSTGATTYTLQIDDAPNLATPIIVKTGLTVSNYTLSGTAPEDLADGQYWWRVFAVNGNGNSPASAVWDFTVVTTLPVQEPKNNSIVTGAGIFAHSGEFVWTVTDMTIPGRGFPFQFSRTYRSSSSYNGPLGYGWTHSYDQRLSGSPGSSMTLYDGTGRADVYACSSGTYISPAGCYDRLEYQSSPDTFTLAGRYGTIRTFGLKGSVYKLTQIEDRNGNVLTLNYDGSNRLSTIVDTLGRTITFTYTAQGRIDYFTDFYDIQNPRKADFTYDANGDLWKVTSPVTTDYPNGKTTTYAYLSGQNPSWLDHNLSSITDPKNQTFLVNTYDNSDRVTQQQYGDTGQNYTFTYASGLTTKTDRNGNITEYYLTVDGNCEQKIEYTNRGIRSGEGDYTTTYDYNLNYEITEIVYPRGNSVEYTFDLTNVNPLSRGNCLAITQKDGPIGNLADIVTTFTYESNFNQVKTTTDALNYTTTNYFDYEEGSGYLNVDLNGDGLTNQVNGNIVKIRHPDVTLGQPSTQVIAEKFWWNSYGQMIRTIDGEGNPAAVYEYYASGAQTGYLWAVTRAYGTLDLVTEYTYDTVGNVLTIMDPRGNTTTYMVNELNQVTETQAPSPFSNYITKYSFDACDNLEQVDLQNVDETGTISTTNQWFTTTYEYGILNEMVSKTEEVSSTKTITTEYVYDANRNQTDVIYPEGNQTHTVFDERNLRYTVTRGYGTADAATDTRNYDGNGNLTESFDGENHRNALNEYCGFDKVIKSTDALGNYTTYLYNTCCWQLTRVRRYSSTNTLLTETDYYYDEVKRRYKEEQLFKDSSGNNVGDGLATTTTLFDRNSRPTAVTDDNSNTTTSFYDEADRLIETVDALGDPENSGTGNKVDYELDENGNVTQVREAQYNQATTQTDVFVTEHVYDELNRLTETHEDPSNLDYVTEFQYDSRGNNVVTTDAEGKVTRKALDGLGRLTATTFDEGGLGIIVSQQWDDNSRLWKQIDANTNTTTYSYSNRDLLTTITYADSSAKVTVYNLDDTVEQMTDANGNVIVNTYNAADLLTERNITRGTNVLGTTQELFEYDAANRMTRARNYDGATLISDFKWYYDTLSNPAKVDETISILAMKSVEYTFDGAGNRLSINYPGGRFIEYQPDALNRTQAIVEAAVNITEYKYAGNRVTWRGYPTLLHEDVTYNSVKDVVSWKNHDLNDIDRISFDYAYTPTHSKKYEKQTDNFSSPAIVKGQVFRYDNIYELTGAKYGVPGNDLDPGNDYDDYTTWEKEEQFVYDGVGNRKTSTKQDYGQSLVTSYYNHVSGTYTPDPVNRYYQIQAPPDPVVNRVHDANGNVTDDGTFTFEYNYKNELMTSTRKSDLQVVGEYNYSCLGQRVMKFASPMVAYIFDGAQVIAEYDLGTGYYNASYVYGNWIDEVIQMDRPSVLGSPFYYSSNQLGSIALITDHTGANVEAYTYTAFGETQCCTWDSGSWDAVSESQIGNSLTYCGWQWESRISLVFDNYEYRCSETGAYQTPGGLSPQLNQYQVSEDFRRFTEPDPKEWRKMGRTRVPKPQARTCNWGVWSVELVKRTYLATLIHRGQYVYNRKQTFRIVAAKLYSLEFSACSRCLNPCGIPVATVCVSWDEIQVADLIYVIEAELEEQERQLAAAQAAGNQEVADWLARYVKKGKAMQAGYKEQGEKGIGIAGPDPERILKESQLKDRKAYDRQLLEKQEITRRMRKHGWDIAMPQRHKFGPDPD
jgi:YD repeat-containing protein